MTWGRSHPAQSQRSKRRSSSRLGMGIRGADHSFSRASLDDSSRVEHGQGSRPRSIARTPADVQEGRERPQPEARRDLREPRDGADYQPAWKLLPHQHRQGRHPGPQGALEHALLLALADRSPRHGAGHNLPAAQAGRAFRARWLQVTSGRRQHQARPPQPLRSLHVIRHTVVFPRAR